MKVFITGGSGFVGSKVTEELIAKKHEVTGLVRSDASAKILEDLGAVPVRGELGDLDTIVEAAKEADAVLHLGFIHDFAAYDKSLRVDHAVVDAVCKAYIGTNKVFIYTSGSLGYNLTDKSSPFYGRMLNEEYALSFADKGVKTMVLRLSPSTHGKGDKGFIAIVTGAALQAGGVYYPGDGSNVWSAVHRSDAAKLYVSAMEKAKAGVIIAAIQERVPVKDLAEAIAKKNGLEAHSVPTPEVMEKMGGFPGLMMTLDNPVDEKVTFELTGWVPTGPKLIEDVLENYD